MQEIDVLLTRVDPAIPVPEQSWQLLSAEEQARASRFRRPIDRAQLVAGRCLLHFALQTCHGITAARIVAKNGNKPRLEQGGPDFNLSHADGLVACVLGRHVDVGIDVECAARAVDATFIAARYFAPAEQQAVHDKVSFMRLWTLKEAVSKAAGLGLSLPLDSFTCSADPPALLQADARLGDVADWRLAAWQEDDHMVAVAVRGDRPIRWRIHRVPCYDFSK